MLEDTNGMCCSRTLAPFFLCPARKFEWAAGRNASVPEPLTLPHAAHGAPQLLSPDSF